MERQPRKIRVQQRLERLKKVRSQTVSTQKKAAAAALAGGIAVLTLYVLFFVVLGMAELPWLFALLAACAGAMIGWSIGIRTASAGTVAGILAGIWIFFEIILAVLGLAVAALASIIG